MSFEPDADEVYETTQEGGALVTKVRIRRGRASWIGSFGHGRAFEVRRVVESRPGYLEFVDEIGRTHYLRPLTMTSWELWRAEHDGPRLGSLEEAKQYVRDAVTGDNLPSWYKE